MGASSKAKAKSTGVAKRTGKVLGVSRGKLKGAASSARNTSKAKTKSKSKAQAKGKTKSKGKTEIKVFSRSESECPPWFTEEQKQEYLMLNPAWEPSYLSAFMEDHLNPAESKILEYIYQNHYEETKENLVRLREAVLYVHSKDRSHDEKMEMLYQFACASAVSDVNTVETYRKSLGEGQYTNYGEYRRMCTPSNAVQFIKALAASDTLRESMLGELRADVINDLLLLKQK